MSLQSIDPKSLNYVVVLDERAAKRVVFAAVGSLVGSQKAFTSRVIVNAIRESDIPVSHDVVTYYLRELVRTLPNYTSTLIQLGGNDVLIYHPDDIPLPGEPALSSEYNIPEVANPHIDFTINFDTDDITDNGTDNGNSSAAQLMDD